MSEVESGVSENAVYERHKLRVVSGCMLLLGIILGMLLLHGAIQSSVWGPPSLPLSLVYMGGFFTFITLPILVYCYVKLFCSVKEISTDVAEHEDLPSTSIEIHSSLNSESGDDIAERGIQTHTAALNTIGI